MKLLATLSAFFVASTHAAPAIVWTSGNSDAAQHTSEALHASELIASVAANRELTDSSLNAVVFILGRDDGGKESLTRLAGEGSLPGVQSKMNSANFVHHHVNSVESSIKLVKFAGEGAVEASLGEFHRKLAGEEESNKKRQRALKNARVLVVSVSPKDSKDLDAAVSKAIESSSVNSVILTSQRSTEEVKRERKLTMDKQNAIIKKNAGRRRLANGDDQYYAAAAANNNMEGIYYVAITPNILAGVLFIFFFAATTYVGITCMGMIQGQDVYTDKYPVIGREA